MAGYVNHGVPGVPKDMPAAACYCPTSAHNPNAHGPLHSSTMLIHTTPASATASRVKIAIDARLITARNPNAHSPTIVHSMLPAGSTTAVDTTIIHSMLPTAPTTTPVDTPFMLSPKQTRKLRRHQSRERQSSHDDDDDDGTTRDVGSSLHDEGYIHTAVYILASSSVPAYPPRSSARPTWFF